MDLIEREEERERKKRREKEREREETEDHQKKSVGSFHANQQFNRSLMEKHSLFVFFSQFCSRLTLFVVPFYNFIEHYSQNRTVSDSTST